MTRDELLALPPTIGPEVAGKVLGIGRALTYELVKRDEFPVKVLRLGNRYRVITADLLDLLGVGPTKREAAPRQGNGSHSSAPATGTTYYKGHPNADTA